MRNPFGPLLFLLALIPTSIPATEFELHLNRYYFFSFLKGTVQMASAPLHWDKGEWLTSGAVVGTALVLYTQDERIKQALQANRRPFLDGMARFGNSLGDGYIMVPLLMGALGTSTLLNDGKLRSSTLLAFQSASISALWVHTLKVTCQRHRPNTGSPYNRWDGPKWPPKHLSFCSGHTGLAFSIAAAYSKYYGTWKVALPAYLLASLTGFARMNDNKHWATDVLVGAWIGISTAESLMRLHQANREIPRIGISPSGIVLQRSF